MDEKIRAGEDTKGLDFDFENTSTCTPRSNNYNEILRTHRHAQKKASILFGKMKYLPKLALQLKL